MEGGVERWREGNNNGDNSDSIKHNVWTRRRKGGSEEGVLSMVRRGRRVEEDRGRATTRRGVAIDININHNRNLYYSYEGLVDRK